MSKQNLNVNGDVLSELGCHECAHVHYNSIPTGGYTLICSLKESPAMEQCGDYVYDQFNATELTGAEGVRVE